MAGLDRVYLTVHTPRYCTYEAAFAGKLAHRTPPIDPFA